MEILAREDKNKLVAIIKSEAFQEAPEVRAQVFEALSVLLKLLPEQEGQEMMALLAVRLDWPIERVAPVMALGSKMDLRRAVQWAPRLPTRAVDESLFPTDGWIGAYLLYAQENESPLAWHFWSAVTIIGAACQRNLYIDRGAYSVWPNYYTILIGPSGSGKTTAIHMATDILNRVNSLLEEDTDWPHDRRIRMIPETITPVRLLDSLNSGLVIDKIRGEVSERWKSSTGFLANDELTTVLGKSNFQSARLIQIFTALYQCPDYWKDSAFTRKNIELRDVSFSILMGSAPDWIRDEVSEAMMNGGFINRCHFCYRKSSGKSYSKPGMNDPIVANALAVELTKLVKAPFMGMTLTDEAEQWFDVWYNEQRDNPTSINLNIQLHYVRKPAHVLKLAMIMVLSRDVYHRVINISDIKLALALIEHEEHFLPLMFDEFGSTKESRNEDLVIDIMLRHGMWMSRREIGRSVYKKMAGSTALDRILKSLKKRGAIEHTVGKRKQSFYRVTASEARLLAGASSADKDLPT